MFTLLQAADAAQAQGGFGNWTFWVMIGAMILIMYFFMWRPESKRRKEMEKFREGLKSGDKVITAGGIYAVVKKVEETTLLIEVDSNVTLRIDKTMVVAAPAPAEKKEEKKAEKKEEKK
ncbi:MAG: preprotein translocase subunit YajC [Alistipes sp.]|nr:preprotein translocase subunit YajC [Alistipes sp.]